MPLEQGKTMPSKLKRNSNVGSASLPQTLNLSLSPIPLSPIVPTFQVPSASLGHVHLQ